MYSILNNITNKFTKLIVGVDVFLKPEGLSLSYVVLKRKGEVLEVQDNGSDIDSFDALKEKLPKGAPLLLSLNGLSVINKDYTNDAVEANELQVLKKTLPGIDIGTIYYQIIPGENSNSHISCIRKNVLDEILEKVQATGFFIADIYLGPFSLLHLKSVLKSEEIVTRNYSFNSDKIASSFQIAESENTSSHNIQGEQIEGETLLSYCNAIAGFTGLLERHINFGDITLKVKEDRVYSFMFKQVAIVALGLLFTILLVNYLVYSSVSDKMASLSGVMGKQKSELKKIEQLDLEIQKKEDYLHENNILSGTRFSYFADRLASCVPGGIKLTSINMMPPEVKPEDNMKIYYRNNIIVNGVGSPSALNKLTHNIENQTEWVRDVDVIDLKSTTNTRSVKFTIQITIGTKEDV